MNRDEIQEIQNIIQDIQMTMDLDERLNNDSNVPLMMFRDGSSINASVSVAKKTEIGTKVNQLKSLLISKVAQLK